MRQELRSKVEKFAKRYCKKASDDPNLWENHVQLVRKFALRLAELEEADKEVVEISALLHDIGKDKARKQHSKRSYELSKRFLEKINLSEKKKKLILKCILKHSNRFSDEDNEIEVKVIQSADALGTFFDEEWQKHSREIMTKQELLDLFDKSFKKINLKSAKKIVKPQIKRLKRLLD
ncbi:HD domain-containing protein [Candidatus Woesearchaeota archaeon]|nr:HD domain-containing protein [Candidatus Woesearchaeota archaeon]